MSTGSDDAGLSGNVFLGRIAAVSLVLIALAVANFEGLIRYSIIAGPMLAVAFATAVSSRRDGA